MTPKPAGVIFFSAASLSTRDLLIADHALLGRRGVTSRIEREASSERGRLSTQPKHNASSTMSS
ncbi:MAG: hypothetical protein ABUL62_28145 [Myxococcales bacterium]